MKRSLALAEWQKIDAILTFILPRVSDLQESALVPITWVTQLDADIRRVVKKALRLSKRTICPRPMSHQVKGDWAFLSIIHHADKFLKQ